MPNIRSFVSIRQDPRASSFGELLQRAGFRIRGRRADCPYCEGHGRSTVAFTDEVAFCHRCKWTRNVRTLSRELHLAVGPETRENREVRGRAALFSAWIKTCHAILAQRLRHFTKRADFAKKVLRQFEDCEPAWDALADFYNRESSLLGALDILVFEKLSPWLEEPMTRERLAIAFNDAVARMGVEDVH